MSDDTDVTAEESGRKRSGKQRLTRAGIVSAAQELVDEAGLAALTMRSLAVHIDADPSAVYRHFRNKDALIGALADAAIAEITDPEERTPDADWEDVLRDTSSRLRNLVRSRPGLATIIAGAPATADTISVTADILRLMREAGISEATAEKSLSAVLAYVLGFSVIEANPPVPGAPGDPTDQGADAAAALRVWFPGPEERDRQFTDVLDLILTTLRAEARPDSTTRKGP